MNHTYQIRRYAAMTAAVLLSACMLAGCAKSDSSSKDNAAGSGNGTNASGNVVAGAGGNSVNTGSIQETAAPQEQTVQSETAAQTAQTNQTAQTVPAQTAQTVPAQTAQTVTGTPETTAQTNAPAAPQPQTQPAQNKPGESDEEELVIELDGGDEGKDDAEDGKEDFTGLFEKPDGTESVKVVLENDTTLSFVFKKSRVNGTAKVSGGTAVYHGDDDYTITFTVADDELGVAVGGEDATRSAMNGIYHRVVEGEETEETEETEFDSVDDDDDDQDSDYFAVFDELETEN